MKLNHDCIRDIMLYIEENTAPFNDFVEFTKLERDLKVYNFSTIMYHCQQLKSAEFVDDVIIHNTEGFIYKLTWDGHEYLDNIRDKTAWKKLKESGLNSMSLDIARELIKEIVIALAKDKLKLK